MTLPRQQLPPVPRAIATAAAGAVTAAWSADLVGFRRAAQILAGLDREQVGLVLGAVVRSLLEESRPGGLTGEDIHDVLSRCAATSAAWLPAVDPEVLLVLLAGSLGIHADGEDVRAVSALEMSTYAPLLISTLLDRSATGRFDARLDAHLGAAFAEILRSETIEMP